MKFKIIMLALMVFLLIACENNSTSPNAELQDPTNLVLEQIGWDSIKLTWQDNNDNETGFRIDRRIGDEEWEVDYRILPENIVTFTDTNLVIIANYTYRVFAEKQNESSGFAEASFAFFYEDVHTISSLNEDQIILYPLESTEFQVCLKDNNGDLVQREYEVWFRFLGRPDGTNINELLYETTDSLSVFTSDGRATVTLNSGEISGNVDLKIFIFNHFGEEISITKSNIMVLSLEPASIELIHGGINEGEDLADLWRIDLNAYVTDVYGNPLSNGTTVYFSLPDNPDFATIQTAEAFIGNINEPDPGVAYNYLIYDGSYTNEPISVKIDVGDISLTEEIVLPLQYPYMDVVIVPIHPDWLWEADTETVSLRFMLHDGQSNCIDNQQLTFEVTLGELIDMGSDDDDDPYTEITGIIDNEHGRLHKDWLFHISECPPPDGDEPGTITGAMSVTIQGTNFEMIIPITLIRYP